MKKIIRSAALTLLVAFAAMSVFTTSCSKSNGGSSSDADSLQVKTFVDQLMKQFYYWADQMPNGISQKNCSVKNYFNSRLVSKDRWSWMMNGETYNSMETGVSTSYGFHLSQPINYYKDWDIYITYVDKNSPLAKAGITRGCQLTHINGTDVATLVRNETFYSEIDKATNNFTFKKPGGETVTLDLTQCSFQSNSVTMTKIFTAADYDKLSKGAKIGYILYTSFNTNLENEITSVLQNMKSQGITDLILDLRYNGGGDLDVCTDIASFLAPAAADGKVFVTLEHNLANQKDNSSYNIKRTGNSFNLNRLFVITGPGTASASETIINCLSPYMDVHTIGETTYGKPNGMYVILYPQKVAEKDIKYAFLPICFYCMNCNGEADFDNGITPENTRYDDLYHDFSAKEDLIRACLVYIASGSYPVLPEVSTTKASSMTGKQIHMPEGFKGAYVKK